MYKKLLALCALCFALSVALFGCGGGKAEPEVDVTIDRMFITANWEGKSILAIDVDIKNNSEVSYYTGSVGFEAVANLNGTNLSSTGLYSNPYEIPSSDIPGGESGKGQMAFELPDTTGEVHLTLSVYLTDYSDKVEIINQTIDLSTVEKFESETEFDVDITRTFFTDDGEGKDIIVLEMTFTNNSDSATSFGSAVELELFQNDIALKEGYLPYDHPQKDDDAYSNTYTDIKNGASINVQIVYELNDGTSDVEIKMIDRQSFDRKPIFDRIITLDPSAQAA